MSASGPHYTIKLERTVPKVLRRLPTDLRIRLARAIDDLAADPRPVDCKKLKGHDELYRIRVGQWRITYAIRDQQLLVLAVDVALRGDAYRKL